MTTDPRRSLGQQIRPPGGPFLRRFGLELVAAKTDFETTNQLVAFCRPPGPGEEFVVRVESGFDLDFGSVVLYP